MVDGSKISHSSWVSLFWYHADEVVDKSGKYLSSFEKISWCLTEVFTHHIPTMLINKCCKVVRLRVLSGQMLKTVFFTSSMVGVRFSPRSSRKTK